MADNPKETRPQHDPPKDAQPTRLKLEIDYERYFKYSRKFDMTEEQQRQLIEAVYLIMNAHVDIEFGIDVTFAACGEVAQIIRNNTGSDPEMVQSEKATTTGAFNRKRGAA